MMGRRFRGVLDRIMPDNEDEERIDEYAAEKQAEIEKRKFQEGQDVCFKRDMDSKWKRGARTRIEDARGRMEIWSEIKRRMTIWERREFQTRRKIMDKEDQQEEEITGQSAIQPPVPDKDQNTETMEEVVGLRRGKRVRRLPKRPYDDFLKVGRRC
ncbi:hypothetical protein ACOME3_003720 [Neoechinorhynchus agilis]